MSDVFISYKREDEDRVGPLVFALEKQGLSVWWDRGLPGGEQWRANIEAALEQAKYAVVIWTQVSTSADGGFVKDEAARAARRKILVPVMLDKVESPLGFGELQAIDLTRWRGSTHDPFFQDLVSAIRAKMQGRDVPAPQGPIKRLQRRLTVGALVSVLVAAASAFATNTLNLQNTVCSMAFVQPWVSDVCGTFGLGGRPGKAERIAWEERPQGDCDALRRHIRQFPEGAYRETATAILSARSVTKVEQWTPVQRPLRLMLGKDVPASATEAAAKSAAIERGRRKAQILCQDFNASGLARFRGADVEPQEWTCESVRGGSVCGFEGRALCAVDELSSVENETCNANDAR